MDDDEKPLMPDPADVARAQQAKISPPTLFEDAHDEGPELTAHREKLNRIRPND